jgi:hypothetical protein
MIGDVGLFLNTLLTYDKNHIPGRNSVYIKNIEIRFFVLFRIIVKSC